MSVKDGIGLHSEKIKKDSTARNAHRKGVAGRDLEEYRRNMWRIARIEGILKGR